MQIQSSLLHLPKKFATLSPEDTDERKETKNPNGSIFSETKTRLETLSNLALQKNHRPLLRVFTHTRVYTHTRLHTHTHTRILSLSIRKKDRELSERCCCCCCCCEQIVCSCPLSLSLSEKKKGEEKRRRRTTQKQSHAGRFKSKRERSNFEHIL